MATVLALALVVFVDGMLSLVLDRDVVAEPGAGPLVAIAATGFTAALVFVVTLRRRPVSRLWRVVAAGLGAFAGAPLAGAIVYGIVRVDPGAALIFFGAHLIDPFTLAVAVVAASVVLAHSFVPNG